MVSGGRGCYQEDSGVVREVQVLSGRHGFRREDDTSDPEVLNPLVLVLRGHGTHGWGCPPVLRLLRY